MMSCHFETTAASKGQIAYCEFHCICTSMHISCYVLPFLIFLNEKIQAEHPSVRAQCAKLYGSCDFRPLETEPGLLQDCTPGKKEEISELINDRSLTSLPVAFADPRIKAVKVKLHKSVRM